MKHNFLYVTYFSPRKIYRKCFGEKKNCIHIHNFSKESFESCLYKRLRSVLSWVFMFPTRTHTTRTEKNGKNANNREIRSRFGFDVASNSAFVAVFLGSQHLWYFPRIYYLENRRKQAKIQGNLHNSTERYSIWNNQTNTIMIGYYYEVVISLLTVHILFFSSFCYTLNWNYLSSLRSYMRSKTENVFFSSLFFLITLISSYSIFTLNLTLTRSAPLYSRVVRNRRIYERCRYRDLFLYFIFFFVVVVGRRCCSNECSQSTGNSLCSALLYTVFASFDGKWPRASHQDMSTVARESTVSVLACNLINREIHFLGFPLLLYLLYFSLCAVACCSFHEMMRRRRTLKLKWERWQ